MSDVQVIWVQAAPLIPETKRYLGDSVYAQANEAGQIILTTENGLPNDPSNTIYLEPEVCEALSIYINWRRCREVQ